MRSPVAVLSAALQISLALILSGCGPQMGESGSASGSAADAARAAAQQAPEFQPGDSFRFDNPDVTWEVVTVEPGRIAWRADNGDTQITSRNPLLPALDWQSPTRGNGKRLITNLTQPMFPLERGKTVSFRATVDTDAPPYAWEYDWRCTIGTLDEISIPAGSFVAYRVACGRGETEELVFHYAPEVGNYVLLTMANLDGGPPQERRLVAFSRGGAMSMMADAEPAMPQLGAVMLEAEEEGDSDLSFQAQAEPAMAAEGPETGTGPTALGMAADDAMTEPMQNPVPASDGTGGTGAMATSESVTMENAVPNGTVAVHLASYKDRNNAEAGWKEFLANHRDLLGETRPLVRRVDLGSRGVFYRLHAGPLSGETAAGEICRTLTQRGHYCKVTKL